MKKQVMLALGAFVLGSTLYAQSGTAATAVCSGTAGPGTSLPTASDGTTFVRQAMTVKCSNNVNMQADQDTAKAWVASASSKGKFFWGGNSDGGGVSKLGGDTNVVTPGSTPDVAGQLDKAKVAGTST